MAMVTAADTGSLVVAIIDAGLGIGRFTGSACALVLVRGGGQGRLDAKTVAGSGRYAGLVVAGYCSITAAVDW